MAIETKKSKKKWWIIGGVILFFIIGAILSEDEKDKRPEETAQTSSQSFKAAQVLNIPETQKAFIQAVTSVIKEYKSAPNELKKSAVRRKRSKAIRQALNGSYAIVNWVGTLKDMGTTSEGNAYLSVQIEGCRFRLQTWNNEFSDLAGNTLIPGSSKLYDMVAELSKRDKVVFSGSFVSGDSDFVGEQSMTEDGSMTDPEFTVVFKKVIKCN